MQNAIVIINAADIPGAAGVAAGLDDYVVYTFDPVLVDKLKAAGMDKIQFVNWGKCPHYADHDPAARKLASALEAKLDAALANVMPGESVAAWQHLNLYYLFMSMTWYGALWEDMGKRLAGTKVHLFLCDTPADFYFNSFIPALQLMWYLKRNDIEFTGFTYGEQPTRDDLVPDLRGLNRADGKEQMLIHLPTCMYHAPYFWSEAVASGKTLIGIESKHFDIALPTPVRHTLIQASEAFSEMGDAERALIDEFTLAVRTTLDRELTAHLPLPVYRQGQVDHMTRLYRAQLVTYLELNRHFSEARPSKLLLSDHDSGWHGPLVSFARKHAIPVVMLPHASTVNHLEYAYQNITVCAHPLQGQEVFDAAGRNLLVQKVAYPEKFAGSSDMGQLKTLSLLLNAISLNGIYYTRFADYMKGIDRIAKWCKANGVALKVRCKPSYSLIMMLAATLDIPAAELQANANVPMTEHVAGCDACVMYDTPTSAAMYFLQNSVPIINATVDEFTPSEVSMGNPALMPAESVAATLRRLEGFLADPSSLHAYRTRQFTQYVQLFQDARPLRSYL